MTDNTTLPGTGDVIADEDIAGVKHQLVKLEWGASGTANKVDTATGKPLPVQVRSATGLIPIGEPTDAAATATDTTSVTGISLWKQISKSVQAIATSIAGTVAVSGTFWQATQPVSNAGTFAVQAVTKNRFIAAAGTTLTRPANTTAYSVGDSISDNGTAASVTAQPVTLSDTNDDPITIERIRVTTNDTGLAAGIGVRVWVYNSDPTASTGVVGGDNIAYSNKRAGFVGTLSGNFRAGHSDGGVAVCTPDEGRRIITAPGSGAKTVWLQYQALDAFTPSVNSTTLIPTVEGYQGHV